MRFKVGKYYVGDLCYVVHDEDWSNLLDDTNYFAKENCTYKGQPIFAANTAYGDGGYRDQKGREYLVDAGILGIMPFELVEGDTDGGQVIDFDKDFEVNARSGVFRFGDIVIDTQEWSA